MQKVLAGGFFFGFVSLLLLLVGFNTGYLVESNSDEFAISLASSLDSGAVVATSKMEDQTRAGFWELDVGSALIEYSMQGTDFTWDVDWKTVKDKNYCTDFDVDFTVHMTGGTVDNNVEGTTSFPKLFDKDECDDWRMAKAAALLSALISIFALGAGGLYVIMGSRLCCIRWGAAIGFFLAGIFGVISLSLIDETVYEKGSFDFGYSFITAATGTVLCFFTGVIFLLGSEESPHKQEPQSLEIEIPQISAGAPIPVASPGGTIPLFHGQPTPQGAAGDESAEPASEQAEEQESKTFEVTKEPEEVQIKLEE